MADKIVEFYYPGWWHKIHKGHITLKFSDKTQIEIRDLPYEDFNAMVDLLRNEGSIGYSDDRALLATFAEKVGEGEKKN